MKIQTVPYLQAWFVFFAIVTITGAIAGGVAGGATAMVLKSSGLSRMAITIASGAAGFLVSVPISFLTFKWAVQTMLIAPLIRKFVSTEAK